VSFFVGFLGGGGGGVDWYVCQFARSLHGFL
jgi:hypothetical protein